VIVRAPRVTIARADCEAKSTVQIRRCIEIAHGMNDMVEASPHRGYYTSRLCSTAAPMKDENNGCGSNGRDFSSG